MSPPARTRPPDRRRSSSPPDRHAAEGRHTIRVEPLEDRSQPSAVGWDGAPPAPPFAASLVSDLTSAEPVLESAATAAPRRELFLLAADVPDRAMLARAVLAMPGTGTLREVVTLAGGGVAEVTDVLARHTGLDAVHLVSHGAAGRVLLGRDVIDAESLTVFSADLRAWGAALTPGGDLLVYGCDVAAGGGRGFVADLARLTGADVAASANPTGAAPGADWALEFATGSIESAALSAAWAHALAPAPPGQNTDPVARDDRYTTNVNLVVLTLPLAVAAPGVLANDADADGDPLTAQLLTTTSNGLLSFNPDGSFTYTAVLNFVGSDSFTYRVSDGAAWSAPATVVINVAAPNQPPTATADAYTTAEDTPLVVPAPGLLANDADPNGDTLFVVLDPGPTRGTLALRPDGSFTYTPAADWSGTDSFTYHVSDGSQASAAVTVTLTVTAVDDPPTLDPIPDRTISEDSPPVTVVLPGITAGGGEAQPLTVTATSSNPALIPNPTVVYASPATTAVLRYQPVADGSGTATITVTVSDGTNSITRTFTVTIRPANDAPTAADDATATDAGAAVTIAVLSNDADADGDALVVTTVGAAANGTVTTNGTTVTYTPAAGWSGTDTFTYTIGDGNGGTARATVTVVVRPAVAPPVDPTPIDPTPVDPTPVDPNPTDPTPVNPVPIDPTPSDPTPPQPTPDPASPPTSAPTGPVATTPVAGGIVGFIPMVAVAGASGVTPVTTATTRGEATRGPVVFDIGRVFRASDAPAGGIGAPEAPAPRAAEPPTPNPVPAPPSPAPATPALPPSPPAVFVAPVAPVAPPVAAAVPPAAVLAAIDEVRSELRADADARATTDTLVVSGGVAVAGYALLNTRAVYWFLSALLARPAVWRRFDPLDVVYAWERDQKAGGPGAGPDESLQSMVG